jgi:hypothetical protein
MTNLNYIVKEDRTVLMPCCDDIQFEYMCVHCYETMGCMFCDFDATLPHDCLQD